MWSHVCMNPALAERTHHAPSLARELEEAVKKLLSSLLVRGEHQLPENRSRPGGASPAPGERCRVQWVGPGQGGAWEPQLVADTWEPLWKVCGAREIVFSFCFSKKWKVFLAFPWSRPRVWGTERKYGLRLPFREKLARVRSLLCACVSYLRVCDISAKT